MGGGEGERERGREEKTEREREASQQKQWLRERVEACCLPEKRFFIELMTSDRKLKASREGSK